MFDAAKAKLATLSREFHFRFAIAAVLVSFHIFMFAFAADDRLNIGFDNAPGEAPAFSVPNAPQLSGRFPREPRHWSRLAVSRWDAQHYIAFALRGLHACPQDPAKATDLQYADCGLAWFPAYGLTAGTISEVTGAPADAVLVVLSCLAALIANLLWTSKTIVDRIGRGGAYAALFAFNLFPSAFFVVTPYPEAAIVALGLGVYMLVARDRWAAAGVLAGAATALAPSAVGAALGLVAAAIASALHRREDKQPRWWRPLYALPLCMWGVGLTFLIYGIVFGDLRLYFHAQTVFAGANAGSEPLLHADFYLKGMAFSNMPMIGLAGALGIIIIVAKDLRRLFPFDELFYLGVAGAMVILREVAQIASRGGGYSQLGRLVLACPIAFLAIGLLARKHRLVYVWWLLLCIGLYWHVDLCSYVTQGDPRACPCLGHFEGWMPWQS